MGGSGQGDLSNPVAAAKVQQVQELMGRRLRDIEELQQRQWQAIQSSLKDQLPTLQEAAEQAVRRQFGDAMRDQAAEISQLRQAFDGQAHDKRQLDSHLESLSAGLRDQAQELERLRSAKNDCASAHEACARERAELSQRLHSMEDQMRNMKSQMQNQASEMEQLKAHHRECAAHREDLQRQINRLKEELPRMAARAAREALENAPPPPRAPSPARAPSPGPAVDVAPDVSEEAFAVLRDSSGDKWELPNLTNIVGRSATCDAVFPVERFSQAISNKHMSVNFASDGTASIKDLDSRNGTFLNEHRVQGTGLVLKPGDHIQLGADGPTVMFEWGPAHYARWPREHQRADRAGGASSSRRGGLGR